MPSFIELLVLLLILCGTQAWLVYTALRVRNPLRGPLRELLELVDISEMENRDLPAHEYEAIHDEAISRARKALKDVLPS